MRVTEHWRLNDQRYELRGTRNPETQEINFPPRPVAVRQLEAYNFHQKDDNQRAGKFVMEVVK